MKRRVPVIFNDTDSFFHRRDPRAKWLLYAMMMLLLYLTPTWEWMAGLALVGAVMVVVARVPKFWVGILLLLQVPNMLSFLIFPAIMNVVQGQPAFAGDFDFIFRLILSWPAALFVSASLFTSMRITELTDGLRGLGIPEIAVFTFEYVILLFYMSINDLYRIFDATKLKGINVETRNPITIMKALPKLALPMFFTILRRSNTMMAVMKMRGYSFSSEGRELRTEFKLDGSDIALLAGGLFVVAITGAVNFGYLELPSLLTVI